MLSTGWYRFVTSWRRLSAGYVALVLIVGLGGGLALGSMSAARRTASSFSVFLASTNPSDLTISPAGAHPIGLKTDRRITDVISRFPHVRHVESYLAMQASFTTRSRTVADLSSVVLVGSVDGLLFDQDRFTVTQGRQADPDDPHQVMVSGAAAQVLGVHVGQSMVISVSPATGSGPPRRVRVTVVGIGDVNRQVVQDQIDRFPSYVVATPALTRYISPSSPIAYFGVQLDGGSTYVPAVEREWNASKEKYFTDFQVSSQTSQAADQSIRPEALALGAFGCIAGLTTLLIAIEEIARQRRARDEDRRIMRSLGASPAVTTTDGLIGTLGSIVLGGVLAAGVTVAVSPLSPIGPVRSVYPGRGFAPDWTVLALGGLALIVLLVLATVLGAALSAPHRHGAGRERLGRSAVAEAVGRSGLPASTVIGTRFALDAGRGKSGGTGRWVLVGAVTALLVVTATLTFGHSLQNLVAQPSLYGWNWDYAVQSSDGYGPVPQTVVQDTLRQNREVAESGVWFATLQLDGVEVPVLLASPGASVAPPLVAGHGLEGKNQIVLGAVTMAQLHKQLGDVISMRYAPTLPRTAIHLTIVGVATMPAIGIAEGLHTSMGIGAVVPVNNGRVTEHLGPLGYQGCSGPNMVFLRAQGAAGPVAAHRAAQQLARSASAVLAKEPADLPNCGGNQASVLAVQRPAAIVNYRSMGLTPVLLAVALAAGATVALGLTLLASVRRRRRELAILKAIGFTPRQLQTTVLFQSGIVALVGIILGVPLGAALGRWLWSLFADQIGAVSDPVVPLWSVVLASLVALVLAVGLSAIPGRIAARTPAVTILSAE